MFEGVAMRKNNRRVSFETRRSMGGEVALARLQQLFRAKQRESTWLPLMESK